MIIFGTKGYLHQLAVLTMVCGWCGNPAAHTVRKRVTKFTLFFVPLFPFSTKFATQCTFCGGERQIPKEEADRLLAQHAAGQDGAYGQAPRQPGFTPPGQGQNPYQR
ncbi:zinc-ribbon domain-containing protein [Streptomyces sp. NPDC049916]|uniref:zinc-ribbon domain-containing protein n=1 Tax=Streptomyces sp. NPDC049916 TaxID=3155156 RepID=UPI0034153600